MTHNNKADSRLLNTLLGAPIAVYQMLLTNGACQRILGLHLPGYLTRVNALLHAITVTRSRKFKQRYLRELAELLQTGYTEQQGIYIHYNSSRTVNSLHNLVLACVEVVNDSTQITPEQLANVRRVDITNSPWWSAVQIGDSKHYLSCLRSGLQRTYPTPDPHVPQMTEEDWSKQLTLNNNETGSNYHEYIHQEVAAFKSGRIVYYGIGTMPHEGGYGWLARVRVHVIEGDAYVEELYGDVSTTRLLHAAVARDYSNAYSYRRYGSTTVSRNYDDDDDDGTYNTYSDGDDLYSINPYNRNQAHIKLTRGGIKVTTYAETSIVRRVHINTSYSSDRTPIIYKCAYVSTDAAGMLLTRVRAQVTRTTDGAINVCPAVPQAAMLNVYYNTVTWQHYGYTYRVDVYGLYRSKPGCSRQSYNFCSSQWEASSYNNGPQYVIPRRKYSWIVNTFMPNSLRKT